MQVIIIGAGPVGVLASIKFVQRGFDVVLYERGSDIRNSNRLGSSFNITLTKRGLDSIDLNIRQKIIAAGVPMTQRIVHRADGTASYQRYGYLDEHFLLSIRRSSVNSILLDEAEKLGVRLFLILSVQKLI